MSAADDAYAIAERLIAEAKQEGAEGLSFDREDTHALTRLPPEIASLDRLRSLDLANTQVSDLAPLAGMTGITTLRLDNTQVSDLAPLAGMTGMTMLWLDLIPATDLRPLRTLTKLVDGPTAFRTLTKLPVDGPEAFGLTFARCGATRIDDRIAEIAGIEDPAERARTLFAYLEDWVPSGGDPGPDDQPFLPVTHVAGQLEIAASVPTEAERDERLKQVLHARLRDKSVALAQVAGNRFPRLAARSRSLTRQVDCLFADLDMLLIHLEIEDLSERAKSGAEDDLQFDTQVTEAMSDVLRLGPGLTLDHPDVEVLLVRTARLRGSPPDPATAEAHADMSGSVASDEKVFGPNLRALESEVAGNASDAARAVQVTLNRGILVRIGRIALTGATLTAGIATGAGAAVGFGPFLVAAFPAIEIVAASYGPPFLRWFLASIAAIPEVRQRIATVGRQSEVNDD